MFDSITTSCASSKNSNSSKINETEAATQSPLLSSFLPITKSCSVPDIHNKTDDLNVLSSSNKKLNSKNEISQYESSSTANETNLILITNPGSIESAIVSPAGSLEQFEVNVNTPLSTEDGSDCLTETIRDTNNSARFEISLNAQSKFFDSTHSSLRFRRHSSQSAINAALPPSSLALNNCSSNSSTNLNTNERICSSPINSLRMSSRVCQIKIDEGIEPHLSREIKSEREMQNTLKLKTSCDELMLNSDELGFESFNYDNNKNAMELNRLANNSPNSTIAPLSNNAFRHNMPSPSLSSCYSYSNSSSPTGGVSATQNSGLLRCFSPSTTLTGNNNNYFAQSPSPTRKLFVTRRSMSPIPCQLRPSSLSNMLVANSNSSSKRKFSEVEQSDQNQTSPFSPKRINNDNQQEFVQPLQIFTGISNGNISRQISSSRSGTLSPFSPLVTRPSSPSPSNTSLIITAANNLAKSLLVNGNSTNKINKNEGINEPNSTNSSEKKSRCINLIDNSIEIDKNRNELNTIENKEVTELNKINNETNETELQPVCMASETCGENNTSLKYSWKTQSNNNEESANKYTFKPIQLAPPSSSSSISSSINQNNAQLNRKRVGNINLLNSSSSMASFSSLAQLNSQNNQLFVNNNSPLNSPALCDSPLSSSLAGEKPDSGYQSSIQNNSDSESCI